MSAPPSPAPQLGVVSLGCPAATVAAETLLARLQAAGHGVADEPRHAALVLLNYCGCRAAAVEASLALIGELEGAGRKIVITGCAGAGDGIISAACPGGLIASGRADDEVFELIRQQLPAPPVVPVPMTEGRLTPPHYAYLQLAAGAHHHSNCGAVFAPPGELHSRPLHELMTAAEGLVADGARELILISPALAAYGAELGHRTGFWNGRPMKTRLPELAAALGELGVWVRLHQLQPGPVLEALLPLMAAGRILPYLDLPLLHVAPRVLETLQRPLMGAEDWLACLRRWRSSCPGLSIRASVVTGLAGESEEDFRLLLDFLAAARLDRVELLLCAPGEGAAAGGPDAVAEERRHRLLDFQEDITTQRLEAKIGRELSVLVDHVDEEGALARTAGDAPEVDGLVVIDDADLEAGDIVRVRITDCDVHDLYAELC